MTEDIIIRKVRSEDLPFIYGTWLHHYQQESYPGRKVPDHIYRRYHHVVMERIVGRPTTQVLVATLPGDLEDIVGFLVSEATVNAGFVAHFAFVRRRFQRRGVARRLLHEAGLPPDLKGVSLTHPTFLWFQALQDKFPLATYNPYLV